jgi:hypothetical protein
MAPQKLRAKHRIAQPSPGKRPYSEVYYELSSGEEDNGKQEKVEEVAGAQALKEGQAIPMVETAEKGDILQPLYDHLSPSVIEALRVFERVSVQNTSLTREVILLEEQNIALRSINRRLMYLLELKDKITTSSSSPPSSLRKET